MAAIKFVNIYTGLNEDVQLPEGTTVAELFKMKMGTQDPGNFILKVNRENVTSGYVMQAGDTFTVTPTKIQGA